MCIYQNIFLPLLIGNCQVKKEKNYNGIIREIFMCENNLTLFEKDYYFKKSKIHSISPQRHDEH